MKKLTATRSKSSKRSLQISQKSLYASNYLSQKVQVKNMTVKHLFCIPVTHHIWSPVKKILQTYKQPATQ